MIYPYPCLTLPTVCACPQLLQHGTTVVRWDGERSSLTFLRLEVTNSLLTWRRPAWGSAGDCQLGVSAEQSLSPGLLLRYGGTAEPAGLSGTAEDGFVSLLAVKEVAAARELDWPLLERRFGLEALGPDSSLRLVFGASLSDNRSVTFVSPPGVAAAWRSLLPVLVRRLSGQRSSAQRQRLWLKEQFLQLYYEEGRCLGPTAVQAAKVSARSVLLLAST